MKTRFFAVILSCIMVFTTTAFAEEPIPIKLSQLGIELHMGITQTSTPLGYTTYVNRNELPANVKNFVFIEVQTHNIKPTMDSSNVSLAGIGTYDESNGYRSATPGSGIFYPIVILFDQNKKPIGYYIGEINNATDSSQIPEITKGISHRIIDQQSFQTSINRSEVPSFSLIRIMSMGDRPLDLSSKGINSYLAGSDPYAFNDPFTSKYYNGGTNKVLVVFFDAGNKPIGYNVQSISFDGNNTQSNPTPKPSSSPSNPTQYGSDIDPEYNKVTETLFTDVGSQYWAYSAIKDLNTRAVITGYPDGKFRPEKVVTRAEFAKIMVLAAGLTPEKVTSTTFTDIKPTDWYTPFIEAAKDYLNGYSLSNGKLIYDPNAPATREDVAVALVKLKGYDKSRLADRSIIQAMFKDYDSISAYALDYIALAVENKLVSGFPDETFKGQMSVTRAQAASMLFRAYQYANDNKIEQRTKVDVVPTPTPTPTPIPTPVPTPVPTPIPITVTEATYSN